jgi:hypothetical protein
MQKTYFHNRKHIIEDKVRKKTISLEYIDQKRIVDINNLLNRVRMDEKNETKRKIIFYSSTVLGLSLFGTLITLLR